MEMKKELKESAIRGKEIYFSIAAHNRVSRSQKSGSMIDLCLQV